MTSAATDLDWLTMWYASRVNGEWEHEWGVAIGTLDNPGWSLRVDLEGTVWRDIPFDSEEREDGQGWSRFWKDDTTRTFHAAGDPTALPAMIARFRAWVEATSAAAGASVSR